MLLSLKVFPDAGKEGVIEDERPEGKRLKVFVREPAQGGRANQGVLRVLAKHLDISESQIRLIKGHKSMQKLVKVDIDRE